MSFVDCIDKVCYLTYKTVESCVLYLATNNSECQIPCKLDGCQTKILNGVRCALWTCEINPTPTPIIPTTTTPPPFPTQNIVGKIVLGIIGFLALSVFLVFLLRKYHVGIRLLGTRLRSLIRRNPAAFNNDPVEPNAPTASMGEDLQPQRDFFSVSLVNETDSDIAFLNVTPPGEASNWQSQPVAGRFTEAAREAFSRATAKAKQSKESVTNFFKQSDYNQL